MAEPRQSIHGQWSSTWVFILAATGSAVGLGNIWKFPYITGENGGGAFVLVYLLCIAVVGIPVMIAEILMGRRGRQSPINTMRTLIQEAGHSAHWEYIGWAGVAAGFLIMSYYSVVAGWALAYIFKNLAGTFVHTDAQFVAGAFDGLLASPLTLFFWHTVFVLMTILVVARGVRSGLERAVRILMPGLFILLLVMVGYAMASGAFDRGLQFMFAADFSRLSGNAVIVAMGHAFFTLSLGMGAIMIYGSYLPQKASIAGTTLLIAGADTVVALLAGVAIFPIVFANGLEPGAGPGLVFQTLPLAFGQMPGGAFFGGLFFILLTLAAWSSAISLLEPAVTWMVENHGMGRARACFITGLAAWVLGVGSVLSFNLWSDYTLFGKTFFGVVDYLTANIMLPLGGLFIAIFAAWIMKRSATQEEFAMGDSVAYRLWRFLIRYVTPVAVLVVFVTGLRA